MYIMGTLLRHGIAAQKAQYLPKIASGELRLQAFGVTEPTAGTDTTGIATTARREGDRYVVNGQKIWTSRAEHSDLMMLLARTTPRDEVQAQTEGMSRLPRRPAPGGGQRPDHPADPHHGEPRDHELFFDNLEVPAENLIGEEGKGFRYILDGLNAERILIAAECIGDARWFIDQGAPPTPRSASCSAGRSARTRACSSRSPRAYRDRGGRPDGARRAARCSTRASPAAPRRTWRSCSPPRRPGRRPTSCLQTHGGFGFADEYDVERKFRETRLYQVAPISTNLILAYVAEHVLGLPRSF